MNETNCRSFDVGYYFFYLFSVYRRIFSHQNRVFHCQLKPFALVKFDICTCAFKRGIRVYVFTWAQWWFIWKGVMFRVHFGLRTLKMYDFELITLWKLLLEFTSDAHQTFSSEHNDDLFEKGSFLIKNLNNLRFWACGNNSNSLPHMSIKHGICIKSYTWSTLHMSYVSIHFVFIVYNALLQATQRLH